MTPSYRIDIREICESHHIEVSFLESLQQTGLILIGESGYISAEQLETIEKYIHFHYDLDINIEGIEAINHLLGKIISQQNEILALKNRLRLYENEIKEAP